MKLWSSGGSGEVDSTNPEARSFSFSAFRERMDRFSGRQSSQTTTAASPVLVGDKLQDLMIAIEDPQKAVGFIKYSFHGVKNILKGRFNRLVGLHTLSI